MAALDLPGIINQVASHALASGYFDKVNTYEPKSAPSIHGISAAIWMDALEPARQRSGLNVTTVLLTLMIRAYGSMLQEPLDMIDPNMLTAVNALMLAYSGDFELNGTVANIDLIGAHSNGLAARAGYVEIDNRMQRVITITLPLVINDVWNQVG